MKKMLRLTVFALIIALFVSCGPTPEKEDNIPSKDYDQSFSTRGMNAIYSANISVEGRSRAVGDNITGEYSLLMSDNKDGSSAPISFKGKDGWWYTYNVDTSYPINDDIFLLSYDHIFRSKEKPTFTYSGSTPIIEEFTNKETYRYRGQLLVDVKRGHALMLQDVDFSVFKGGIDHEMHTSRRFGIEYNEASFSPYGSNIYFTGTKKEAGVFMIDLNNPQYIRPITNYNYLKAVGINKLNSEIAWITSGADESYASYFIDLEGKRVPYKVPETPPYMTIEGKIQDKYNYEFSGIGYLQNEKRLGDEWWYLGASHLRPDDSADTTYNGKCIAGAIKIGFDENLKPYVAKTLITPPEFDELGIYHYIYNIREMSKGVFRIYSASNERRDVYITELDTNGEGSFRLISHRHVIRQLPEYFFSQKMSSDNPWLNDKIPHDSVLDQDGHTLWYISEDSYSVGIDGYDFETGEEIWSNRVEADLADKRLIMIGDKLIFSAYDEGSGVNVSSWYYEKSNMSAKPEKFASYKMEIIPLVTLDSAQL